MKEVFEAIKSKTPFENPYKLRNILKLNDQRIPDDVKTLLKQKAVTMPPGRDTIGHPLLKDGLWIGDKAELLKYLIESHSFDNGTLFKIIKASGFDYSIKQIQRARKTYAPKTAIKSQATF